MTFLLLLFICFCESIPTTPGVLFSGTYFCLQTTTAVTFSVIDLLESNFSKSTNPILYTYRSQIIQTRLSNSLASRKTVAARTMRRFRPRRSRRAFRRRNRSRSRLARSLATHATLRRRRSISPAPLMRAARSSLAACRRAVRQVCSFKRRRGAVEIFCSVRKRARGSTRVAIRLRSPQLN